MAYVPPLNGGRINATIAGNTAGAGALISTGNMVLAGGNNITLSQAGNNLTISGANSPTASVNFSAGTTSANLASVKFANSNGMAFGLNAGTITASATPNLGISGGGTAYSTGTVNFLGGGVLSINSTTGSGLSFAVPGTSSLSATGAVSISANGGTISIGAPNQTNQNLGLFAAGNTFNSSTATADARSLTFNGVGAAKVGFSAGSVQLSVPTQSAQTQSIIQGLVGGTATSTASTGTVTFGNANGVTFGMSGNTMTASVAAAQASSFVSSGAIGITTAGNTVTISAPAQSNQTLGLFATGNVAGSSNTTLDARNVTFNGLGAASVGFTNGSVQISTPVQSAQTQSNIQALVGGTVAATASTGTVNFGNANGVTFGINGNTMTASVAAAPTSSYVSSGAIGITTNGSTVTISAPTQTNQTLGLYATGNIAGSSNTTLDARNVTFNGLGAASVGFTNGSVQISAPVQSAQTQSVIQSVVAGTATATSGSISFANSNGVNFGMNNGTITASATPNLVLSGGGTAYSTGTVNFQAGGALTINSTTGQGFSFAAPAVSSLSATGAVSLFTTGSTVSIGAPVQSAQTQSNIQALAAGTTAASTGNILFSNANGVSFGMNGNTMTASIKPTGTLSQWGYPDAAFGPVGGSTGSLSIQHMYIPFNVTGSAAKIGGSLTVKTFSNAGVSASVTYSLWMGLYTLNGSTLSLATSGSGLNTFNYGASGNVSSTYYASNLVGMREMTVPMTVNITPGEYWLGAALSGSTSGTYGSTTGQNFTLFGNSAIPSAAGLSSPTLTPIGTGVAAANDVFLFEGMYSAGTGAGPTTIAGSQIVNTTASAVLAANIYAAFFNTTY